MVTRQYHGIASLLLIVVAILVGALKIFWVSPVWSMIYLGISLISAAVIIFSFCSKCPCRVTACGHVFPGKLTKYLPKREESPYETRDLVGVIVPIIILFIFPQPWLIQDFMLLSVFWGLILVALIDISLCVCKGCTNNYCPVHKKG